MTLRNCLAESLVVLIVAAAFAFAAAPAQAEAGRMLERDRYIAPPAKKTDIALVIDRHRRQLYDDPAAPVIGNPQGSTTLVMFFDYRCPYCKKVAPVVEALVRADPSVRVIYKELPILGAPSMLAAKAALAAARQGRYIEFHRAMMQTRGRLSQDRIMAVAGRVGLDRARLAHDMADPEIAAAIQRNKALAAALDINGTPAYVVNRRVERGTGDLQDFRELIADVAMD